MANQPLGAIVDADFEGIESSKVILTTKRLLNAIMFCKVH
jgi:hypothetical protein